MKRPVEKDPKALLALRRRLAEAKRTPPPNAYVVLKLREPELRHEAKPWKLTDDKDERLIQIASMRVLWDNIETLPCTGWSALRELSKLSE